MKWDGICLVPLKELPWRVTHMIPKSGESKGLQRDCMGIYKDYAVIVGMFINYVRIISGLYKDHVGILLHKQRT